MATALYYYHDSLAPEPNRKPRFGIGVVIEADGKILLEHRQDNFMWGIVSGDIHADETFRQCAVRKTMDETGIHLTEWQLHDIRLFDDPTRIVSFAEGNIYRIVSMAYFADLFTAPETVCGDESIELCWVPIEEMYRYDIVAVHRDILEEYFRIRGYHVNLKSRIYQSF